MSSFPDPNQTQQLQQMQQQMMLLEQQGQSLEQQREHFSSLIQANNSTIETLKGIENPHNKTEFLLPLSGGVYVEAKVTDFDEVLVNVGSGTVVPKKINEAIKDLEGRNKEFRDFVKKMDEELKKISDRIGQIQQLLQQGQNQGISPDTNQYRS